MYGVKTAAFFFARALNKTEEFQLASNVDGAGAFDDLVFRYRLRESGVWKTCFIQLKHKKIGGTIQRSSLTQMSGDFSLLKYFMSFCEIKNNAAKDSNQKVYGPFDDFEFVIYTNGNIESKSKFKGGVSDPLSILSSGTDKGKYMAFVEQSDTDIFGFFEELSRYHELIKKLDNILKTRASGYTEINDTIKELQNIVENKMILEKLEDLKSKVNKENETKWIEEVAKCDFKLFKEFLSKFKIFQNQSKEESLKRLTEKELQNGCKASPSVANLIYTKFKDGFSMWWKKRGNVVWLNENSELWQGVRNHIISEIKKISELEIQEIGRCNKQLSQNQLQKFSEAMEHNNLLNIVINSDIRIIQKMTCRALNTMGYTNSLFIGIKSLILREKNFKTFWPCKWCNNLVVNCGSDFNMAKFFLEDLQTSADLVHILKEYKYKVIFFSPRINDPALQTKLRKTYKYIEVSFDNRD